MVWFLERIVCLFVSLAIIAQDAPAQSNQCGSLLAPPKQISWSRSEISSDELGRLFESLKNDERFRMKFPGAHCYHRSQLLGWHLETEEHLQTQQLYMDCAGQWIFATDPLTGETFRYGDHWTNVVQVRDPKTKRLQWMVLDPQFQEQPVPIEDYVRGLTFKPVKLSESNEMTNDSSPIPECRYRRVDRRSYQSLSLKIMRYNEKKEEELGLVNAFGGRNPMSPEERQKKEAELLRAPSWFDPRMMWDQEDLIRLEEEVRSMNKEFFGVKPPMIKPTPEQLQQFKKLALKSYFDEMEMWRGGHQKVKLRGQTKSERRQTEKQRREVNRQTKAQIDSLKKIFQNELQSH